MPQAFDESNEDWKKEYAELKELLTADEYDSARGSTLNAHYTCRAVINAQMDGCDDDTLADLQGKLSREYDSFSRRFGRINDPQNARAFDEDSSYYLICGLENMDAHHNFIGKSDMFTQRTIRQNVVPTTAGTAQEALLLSMSEKARVDMDYMSSLTGRTEEELFSELRGEIFKVPSLSADGTGKAEYQTADEYLSGDVDNDSSVSLYLVLNPTNIQRLKPLVRLFISQLVFILMPEMEFSGGQMKAPYKHRLLLLLDEFPALGKLGIFEQAIAYFGGWNIKAYLICQDKAQLDAAYGKDESITSNCHVTVAYAPNKVETAKYLSDRLGVTTVIKEQESISFQGGTGLFAKKSVTKSQQEVQRAVLTPDEIMRLPGPIKDVYQNITEPGDMLVFAAGFPPVYGKQILYFLDKTFSERSKIDAPEESDRL